MNIEIDNLDEGHGFPSIDFKFQNNGNAQASINSLDIQVSQVELDWSPELHVKLMLGDEQSVRRTGFSRHSDSLAVIVNNFGWGDLVDGHFVLSNPIFQDLFPKRAIEFAADIKSGEGATFLVHFDQINQDALRTYVGEVKREQREILEGEFERNLSLQFRTKKEIFGKYHAKKPMEYWRNYGKPIYKDKIPGFDDDTEFEKISNSLSASIQEQISSLSRVILRDVVLHSSYTSKQHQNTHKKVLHPQMSVEDEFGISSNGFYYEHHMASYCIGRADTNYACVIDVEEAKRQTRYSRSYRISRLIDVGEIDHFQIMLGATKSCRMKVVLVFHTEKEPILSKPFEIHVKNSRRSRLHEVFKDGSEILLDYNKRRHFPF